jgi:hypothetical protein
MTAIWTGVETVKSAAERIEFDGNSDLRNTMQTWLCLSPFAVQEKLVV